MLMLRAEKEREQQALLEAAAEAAGPATPSISSALQQQPLDIIAECFTPSSAAQDEKQQRLQQEDEDLLIQEEVCEWDPIYRQATAPLVQRVGVPAALLVSLHNYEQAAVTCVNNAASDEQSQWSC